MHRGTFVGGAGSPSGLPVQISLTLLRHTSATTPMFDVYVRTADSLKWLGMLRSEDVTMFSVVDYLVRHTWDNVPKRIQYRMVVYGAPDVYTMQTLDTD